MFSEFTPPELEVFASERSHYRYRSEFRVWHEGADLYYYMFDKTKEPEHQKIRCSGLRSKRASIQVVIRQL